MPQSVSGIITVNGRNGELTDWANASRYRPSRRCGATSILQGSANIGARRVCRLYRLLYATPQYRPPCKKALSPPVSLLESGRRHRIHKPRGGAGDKRGQVYIAFNTAGRSPLGRHPLGAASLNVERWPGCLPLRNTQHRRVAHSAVSRFSIVFASFVLTHRLLVINLEGGRGRKRLSGVCMPLTQI